jgi:hypothetical protein
MPSDIREFYRVLELSPGASLDEIKRSYRRLLQQWHPDRYKPGSVMQTTAEDVTKDLNEAYHQLCRKKRYLEFRPKTRPPTRVVDPPDEAARAFRPARRAYAEASRPAPGDVAHERKGPESSPPPPAPPPPPPKSPKPPVRPRQRIIRWPRRFPWPAFVVVAGAVMAVWTVRALWGWWDQRADADSTPLVRVSSSAWRAPSSAAKPAPPPPAATRISEPERARAVASAQSRDESVPSARGEDVRVDEPRATVPVTRLPFGTLDGPSPVIAADSRRFDFGLPLASAGAPAFAWNLSSARLTLGDAGADARREPSVFEMPTSLLDTFGAGDTKARVLEVQGVPDETGENVFRYGSSLVYFTGGRVALWRDGSPPLRVLLLPRFEFSGAATFGVGSTRSEVVHVQGVPTQTTANAYYYGASAVYFDRAWVVGWTEVDQPLRARSRLSLARIGLLPRSL